MKKIYLFIIGLTVGLGIMWFYNTCNKIKLGFKARISEMPQNTAQRAARDHHDYIARDWGNFQSFIIDMDEIEVIRRQFSTSDSSKTIRIYPGITLDYRLTLIFTATIPNPGGPSGKKWIDIGKTFDYIRPCPKDCPENSLIPD